jgi:uncharacterized protein DUF3800
MEGKHSYIAYIDESGDEGFRLGVGGSSEWFVLSAVAIPSSTELATVKLVDEVRALMGTAKGKPLHFSNLDHNRRVAYIDHVSRARLRIMSVIAHKPSLVGSTLPTRNRLYFYCARLLVERVSWFCRDAQPNLGLPDCTTKLVFSHRSATPYHKLRDYFERLKNDPSVKIHWPAIDVGAICALGHERRRGLQVADAVAGGFYAGLAKGPYGHTEPRFARMLKPVVYKYGGKYLSYGLKFLPNIESLIDDDRLGWVKEFYK